MSGKINQLRQIANLVRQDVLRISYNGQIGHIGSALSVVDILTALYFSAAKIYPQKPDHPNRDRVVLSKGHGCAALYSILYRKGFISKKTLYTYHLNHTQLLAHQERHLPGVETSAGSLGHGLSLASGMALANKLDQANSRVFAILSDGECDEGSTWEAALVASHRQLNCLTAIIDYNQLQAFGRTNQVVNLEPFKAKWQAFGWSVVEVNGHDFTQLLKAFSFQAKSKPTVIIARTVLGKGISFMEDRLDWHYLNLTKDQFAKSLQELKSSL